MTLDPRDQAGPSQDPDYEAFLRFKRFQQQSGMSEQRGYGQPQYEQTGYAQSGYEQSYAQPEYVHPGVAGSVGAGFKGAARGGAFHTLRTLRGPIRLMLGIASVLFGIIFILSLVQAFGEGNWGVTIVLFVMLVVLSSLRFGYDSLILKFQPPGTNLTLYG